MSWRKFRETKASRKKESGREASNTTASARLTDRVAKATRGPEVNVMRATTRSVMGLVLTLTMGTSLALVGMMPASAATPANSTAFVNVDNILAGTPAQGFQFTIRNTEAIGNNNPGPLGSAAGPSINMVEIAVPGGGWIATGGAGPGSGWNNGIVRGDNRSVNFSGGTLAPQATQVFTVIANAPTPGRDITGDWTVTVSSDGGVEQRDSTPTGAGLDTTVRILTAEFPGLTQPAGITDLSVTQGQGTDARDQTPTRQPQGTCAISNHGSATVLTRARLTGDQISGGQEPTSGGTNLTPGASDVPFGFNLSFGNPGTKATTCNARAFDGAGNVIAETINGFNETKNIVIENRVTFTVNDFSPKVVVPGSIIGFQVDVTAQGVPAAILDSTNTLLEFDTPAGHYGPVPLTSTTTFPRGAAGARRVVLSFASALIPGSALDDPNTPTDDRTRGSFDIFVDFVGEDDNNTTVSFLDQNIGDIRLDPDLPELILNPPDGPGFPAEWTAVRTQADYDKVPEAVANGGRVDLTGTVKDADPFTGALVPCGSCPIQESYLRQFRADGTEIDGARIPVPATNSGGTITATYTGAYHAEATTFDWVVSVTDSIPDHLAGADSLSLAIDNLAPSMISAATQRKVDEGSDVTGQDRNTVLVTFSECVAGTSGPLAWSIEVGDGSDPAEENPVIAVAPPTCQQQPNGEFRSFVELTTAQNLPEDGDDPGLTFGDVTFTVRTSDKYVDRVNKILPNGAAVDLRDGIAPLASTITSVTPGSSDEGKLYTNSTSPTIVVTGSQAEGQRALKPGYKIELFEESNDTDGLQRGAGGDRPLGSHAVQGPDCNGSSCTVSVPATNLSFDEGEKALYAIGLDTAPQANISPAALATLVLDQTVPVVIQVVPTVGKIVVNFSEKITFGRNAGNDWLVYDLNDRKMTVVSVAGTGITRDLNISNPLYSPTNMHTITYEFFGIAGQRYADRATNELGDFTVDMTQG